MKIIDGKGELEIDLSLLIEEPRESKVLQLIVAEIEFQFQFQFQFDGSAESSG